MLTDRLTKILDKDLKQVKAMNWSSSDTDMADMISETRNFTSNSMPIHL